MGKSTIESYFDFKADWIIEFNRLVLPKASLRKIDLEQFKKNVYKYYLEVVLNNKKIDNLFIEEDVKVNIQKSLIFNGILEEEFQILFASLFKEELIISWLNELTNEEKVRKNLCMELATTVYLALELDKHISPDASKKIAYNTAIKELFDKHSKIITEDILENVRNNSIKLSKLFSVRQDKNFKFIKTYNEFKNFKISYLNIYQTIDSSKTNMYLSNLNYSIKELENNSKKEVLKIFNKDNIQDNLKKIELEIVSYNLFEKLYNHCVEIIFVKLNDDFLSKKNNISCIENTICAVKNNIILSISYGQSIKYKQTIDNLRLKGYKIACEKDEMEISFKKLYDTKYFFINYDESMSYTKTISELEIGKIEPIVINLNLENKKNIKYYMK